MHANFVVESYYKFICSRYSNSGIPLGRGTIGSRHNGVWFTNCTFSDNLVQNLGIILCVASCDSAHNSEVHVKNCNFNANHIFIAIEATSGFDVSFN